MHLEITIDQALQEAIKAHRAGKVQEADQLYTAILKVQPNHPDANHNLGVLAVSLDKAEEALPFIEKALEANQNVRQFWLTYVDTLIRLDLITDARTALDQAKAKFSGSETFNSLSQRIAEREAILLVYKSEARSKQTNILENLSVDRSLNLANKKLKKGLYSEAESIYLNILKKFPKNARAKAGLKQLSSENKSSQVVDPSNTQLKELVTLYNNEKFDQALKKVNILVKKFGRSPTLLNIKGAILHRLGNLNMSAEAYSTALSMKPNFAEALYNLGSIYQEQGKWNEAIQHYDQAIAIKPDYAAAHNNRGTVLQDQGMIRQAIEAYVKAVTFDPDFADALNNLGLALTEQGKHAEAVEVFRKAIIKKPDSASFYNNKALAFQKLGMLEEAISALKKATSIEPEHAEASHFLAALTGQNSQAPSLIYVENLFDKYSKRFDASLTQKLEYRMPEIMRGILLEGNEGASLGSILDLGCGTGQVGRVIKNHCDYLEGIDISAKMLEHAQRTNVYDKLINVDILSYLSNEPLDFDYFIAADVFIYLGDLSEVFRLVKLRNERGGKLVFSTEHAHCVGFQLEKSGRYSHSKIYISELCSEFGYSLIHFSENPLRKENGKFLDGGTYVLQF